jgi:hypothetical protein
MPKVLTFTSIPLSIYFIHVSMVSNVPVLPIPALQQKMASIQCYSTITPTSRADFHLFKRRAAVEKCLSVGFGRD